MNIRRSKMGIDDPTISIDILIEHKLDMLDHLPLTPIPKITFLKYIAKKPPFDIFTITLYNPLFSSFKKAALRLYNKVKYVMYMLPHDLILYIINIIIVLKLYYN